MNQNINFNSQFPVLNTINQVDGFDPSKLTVDYVDLTTQEKRKRLPVMAQLAWFRLRHPEGKIALHVEPVKDYFVATARVYVSYKDPADCYLSEATASRKYDPLKPTVSPREWAQTAAIGIALRNAGFGLQFSAAGDGFDGNVPDELGAESGITPPAPMPTGTPPAPQPETESPAVVTAPPVSDPELVIVELTPEQEFEQACAVVSPIKKHGGKTLGEVLSTEPRAINWLASKFSGDETIRAAAEYICNYAMEQTPA